MADVKPPRALQLMCVVAALAAMLTTLLPDDADAQRRRKRPAVKPVATIAAKPPAAKPIFAKPVATRPAVTRIGVPPTRTAAATTATTTGAAIAPAVAPAPHHRPSPEQDARLRLIGGVKSWGYQLKRIDPLTLASAPVDMLVVDHAIAANRRFVRELAPDEIRMMQRKPDGSRRLVLAYLSVGEAERYRFYWNGDWYEDGKQPSWLGAQNPRWEGNYLVKFWDPDWQRLIFGSPGAYLERIIAAGFDGIYIDRADVFSDWARRPGEVADAETRMVDFLLRMIAHARQLKPDLLVVQQNAEELMTRPTLRFAIDALAKEDLYYGVQHDEQPNPPADVAWSMRELRLAMSAGRRVFLVEYLADPAKLADAQARARADKLLLTVAPRHLGHLLAMPAEPAGAAAVDATPSTAATATPPPAAPTARRRR